MNDPKSWVRQQLVFMFAGALIAALFIQMLAPAVCGVEVAIPWEFWVISGSYVGEHSISREIEKRRNK